MLIKGFNANQKALVLIKLLGVNFNRNPNKILVNQCRKVAERQLITFSKTISQV